MRKIKYYEEDGRTRDERESRLPNFTPNNERKGGDVE